MAAIDDPFTAAVVSSRGRRGIRCLFVSVFYIPLFAVAVAVAIWGQDDFNHHAVRTRAQVVRTVAQTDTGANPGPPKVTVRWTPVGRTSASTFNSSLFGNVWVGEMLVIRYDSRHPNRAYPGANGQPPFLAIVLLFGIPLCFVMFVTGLKGIDDLRDAKALRKQFTAKDWIGGTTELWATGFANRRLLLLNCLNDDRVRPLLKVDTLSWPLRARRELPSDVQAMETKPGEFIVRIPGGRWLEKYRAPRWYERLWIRRTCRRSRDASPLMSQLAQGNSTEGA